MDAIEQRTLQIGRDLFRRVEEISAYYQTPARWLDEKAMAWSLRDPFLKSQLFRFIDVLPTLTTPHQIEDHLRGYLDGRLPEKLWRYPSLLSLASRAGASHMARRFIAADESTGAIIAARKLRKKGLDFTIDFLGEAVVSEKEAEEYAARYIQLIDDLTNHLQGVNVSIKLSSLHSQFDPIDPSGTSHAVRDRLRPILRLARRRNAFVYFDMEQHAFKDITLQIFKEILTESEFSDWPDCGIVIQAYLRSSPVDLSDLAEWAAKRKIPIWVRLVKGAYWDYERVIAAQNAWPDPVFIEKSATDANFETLTEFLIAHHKALRPAIASHNIRAIAHALAIKGNTPIEFQMLYGMADEIKRALVDIGQHVRVYMPVGRMLPGMAYLARRLLENTSNESFLRAGFLEHLPAEKLLMKPILAHPAPPPPSTKFINTPPTDFSDAAARRAMKSALTDFRSRLGRRYCPIIAGRQISTFDSIESINPSEKLQTVGRCGRATPGDALEAIAAAKAAFPHWRDRTFADRANLLKKVAAILRRRRFELTAVEVFECGKPWREADADVAEAIDFCEYYAREALRLGTPGHQDFPGETNEHFYEPRGVAVIIAPWNFPLAILCGMTSAAVVAGNTAIMKPAEQSSVIAALLQEAFDEAGVPPGVVNYLPGIGEELGPILTTHPDVAIIAFTGSRAVGLSINEIAARTPPGQTHIKRIITEMGGKNAIIVDEDADLDEAVRGICASAFGYAGQKCSACSRVIVLESIYESLTQRLIEAAQSLKIAPAEDPACSIGPVIDHEAFSRITQAIERGKSQAKTLLAPSAGPLADRGFFIASHIFGDVSPESTLAQEEIFGPVLSIVRAPNLTHAIQIANGTTYALTGGIYSRNPNTITQARCEFRVGDLYINRKITGALVGRQPFGGFKLSGTGTQAGGPDYLQQFLIARVITENTLRHGITPEEKRNVGL